MLVSWRRGGRMAIALRMIVLAASLACLPVLLLICDARPAHAATQPRVNEYMMLIDTSKSMAGYKGSKNIFPAVKKAVNKYVEGLPLGSVVYVNSFDSQLTKRRPVRLQSDADKRKVEATVNGLTAEGMTTAIYHNEESFFVRHAYFTGVDECCKKLQRALKSELDEAAWSTRHSTVSRPFDAPLTGTIAVKVINRCADEVLKVHERGADVEGTALVPIRRSSPGADQGRKTL